MTNFDATGILKATDFAQYATNWTAALETASDAQLKAYFWTAAGHAIPYVSFPIAQIVRLVSTIGSTNIKARFLLKPAGPKEDGAAKEQHFALALFATNSLDARVSSYYLADGDYTAGAAESGTGLQGQVDHALVKCWLDLWATIDTPESKQKLRIKPAVFHGNYGPMQGYTFDTSDFLDPLFSVTSFNDQQQVRIYLALHEYYHPTPDGHDELKHTLGLVVRVIGPDTDTLPAKDKEVGSDPSTTYFYDMSKPCPPTC